MTALKRLNEARWDGPVTRPVGDPTVSVGPTTPVRTGKQMADVIYPEAFESEVEHAAGHTVDTPDTRVMKRCEECNEEFRGEADEQYCAGECGRCLEPNCYCGCQPCSSCGAWVSEDDVDDATHCCVECLQGVGVAA